MNTVHTLTPTGARFAIERRERLARIAARAWSEQIPVVETAPSSPEIIWPVIPMPLGARHIQGVVCLHDGIELSDMLSPSRFVKLVLPRAVAMYVVKKLTFRSFHWTGWQFAGRDHSAAVKGFRKIERLMQTDPQLRADVAKIMEVLK